MLCCLLEIKTVAANKGDKSALAMPSRFWAKHSGMIRIQSGIPPLWWISWCITTIAFINQQIRHSIVRPSTASQYLYFAMHFSSVPCFAGCLTDLWTFKSRIDQWETRWCNASMPSLVSSTFDCSRNCQATCKARYELAKARALAHSHTGSHAHIAASILYLTRPLIYTILQQL